MLFSAIKDEIEDLILDLPSGAATRIATWANKGIRDACDRRNWRCMEATQSITSADDTRVLATKDALWKENRGNPWLLNQDGSTSEIDWAPSEADMIAAYGNAAPVEGNTTPIDEGRPKYILERIDTLECFPFPDNVSGWTNGLYRVRAPYWAYLADLILDADHNYFTDNAPWYVIFKAVAEGAARNEDFEKAGVYEAKAEKQYKIVERRDKMSRLPDRMTLNVRRDVYKTVPRSITRG